MPNEQKYFSIQLSVSRNDLKAIGYDNADNLSDNIMRKIAEKMANYYSEDFINDLDEVMSYTTHLTEGRTKSRITQIYVDTVGKYTRVTFFRIMDSRVIYTEHSLEEVLARFPIPRDKWLALPPAESCTYPVYYISN